MNDQNTFHEQSSNDLSPKLQELEQQNRDLQSKLESLGSALTGGNKDAWGFSAKDHRGNPAPKSWDEGAATIARRAKEEAKEEILSALDKKEKAKEEAQKRAWAASEKRNEEMFASWDKDVDALWTEGDLPAAKPEELDKWRKGQYSDEEALKIPAFKARRDLMNAALTHKRNTGEAVNLYRFAKTQYKKQAGMDAPVFDGSSSYAPVEEETDYETIHNVAKQYVG